MTLLLFMLFGASCGQGGEDYPGATTYIIKADLDQLAIIRNCGGEVQSVLQVSSMMIVDFTPSGKACFEQLGTYDFIELNRQVTVATE
jgi:hypothetical protein